MFWILTAGIGTLIVISLLLWRAFSVKKSTQSDDKLEITQTISSSPPQNRDLPTEALKPELSKPHLEKATPAKIVPPIPPSIEREVSERAAVKTDAIKAYPAFNHRRAVDELGLSEEEALDFISDMIVQIDEEIPKLDREIAKGNAGKVELIVHMLKGSAVSLGNGGIADVLMEFNAYCHNGTDMDTIRSHMRDLKYYQDELKKSYA